MLVVTAVLLFLVICAALFYLGMSEHPKRYGGIVYALQHLPRHGFEARQGSDVNVAQRHVWFALAFIPVCAVASASVVLLFWNRRVNNRRKTAAYLAILGALVPVSAINFVSGDNLMAVEIQVLLDIAMLFLGTVAIMFLLQATTEQHELVVLKYMAVFGLAIQTVILPTFYAVSFLLIREQWGKTATSISGIAAVVGYVGSLTKWMAKFVKRDERRIVLPE